MKKNRRFLKSCVILASLCSVAFIFRKAILLSIVKVVLALSLGKQVSLTYEKIGWEEESIRLDEVSFANRNVEVAIDQVNLSFSLFPFNGEVKVFRPHVHIKQGGVSTSLPWMHLFSSRLARLMWKVSDGVINYEGHDPVYFSFLSDKENVDTLGKIWLSYEPQESALPLLAMELKRNASLFELQFSLHEENLAHSPLRMGRPFFDLKGMLELQGTLVFDEKRFHEATVAMQGELEQKGVVYPFALQAVGKQAQDAFLLKLHLESPQEVHADFTFTKQAEILELQGTTQIDGVTCRSEATFDCPASSLSALLWKKGRCLALREGHFTTEALSETTYAPFLHLFNPDVILKGRLSCTGNFDSSYVALAIQAEECILGHEGAELAFSTSPAAPIHLVYVLNEKKWEASIPLQGATLAHSKTGFTLKEIDTELRLSDRIVSAPHFAARLPLCSVDGSFEMLTYDAGLLRLEQAQMQCHLQNGTALTWHIPHLHIFDEERPCADFHLQLKEAMLECVGSVRPWKEAGWEFILDPQKTRCCNTLLNISTLKVEQGKIAHLEMQPLISGAQIPLILETATRLNGITLPGQIPSISGALQLKLCFDSERLFAISLQGQECAIEGKKIAPFTLRGVQKGRFFELEECQADALACKARLSLSGTRFSFDDAEGTWQSMRLKGKGELDLASRLLTLHLDDIEGALPLSTCTGTLHAHGTLTAQLDTSMIDAEGMCTVALATPLSVTAWNTKPFKIHYSKEGGYTLSEGQLYVRNKTEKGILGSLFFPKILASSTFDEVKISACQCSLRPALLQQWNDASRWLEKIQWPEAIEAAIDVTKKGKEWSCRGRLKDGKYGLSGQQLDLSALGFSQEQGVLSLFAKIQVGTKALWTTLSSTLERPQGSLQISDQPEGAGLGLSFKTQGDDLQWEKVQGSCLGIQVDLERNEAKKVGGARAILSGQLDIDASQIGSLFPKEIREKIERAQLGKGYHWQGDLILWKDPKRLFQMTGEITGEEWELYGYRFDRLRAGVDLHPDLILLSEVQIEDAAGSAAIKKIELAKKEKWELSIPIVSIREWHPSSMRQIEIARKTDKPFRIRNFTVSGIRALLGNAESLQGHGRLTFTNGVKKEASLFDAPLEIIKNFGLDPGLLTPVQGELEVDLHGDRLYLTTLKDAFSEGKRSEFYLAPGRSPSYIGLDGKMHIDLKMHQDVTLKVTEACVLTIRGTLDNPRYGLQF